MTEVVVMTGDERCAKLQSNCHHLQTRFKQVRRPSRLPTNSVKALKEKFAAFRLRDTYYSMSNKTRSQSINHWFIAYCSQGRINTYRYNKITQYNDIISLSSL